MYDFLTIISCKDGTIKDLAGKTNWEIIGYQDRIYADITDGKFGNGCLHLYRTTDNSHYQPHTYMQSTRDDIWWLEDKDFTISLWFKFITNEFNSYNSLISMSGFPSNGIFLKINDDYELNWAIGDGSKWVYELNNSYFDRSSFFNNWHHVAMIRKGTRLLIFIDGIKTDEDIIGTYSLVNTKANLLIGSNTSNGGAWDTILDDIEIIKGYAVWDSNFSVPTKQLYKYINNRLLFNLKVGD